MKILHLDIETAPNLAHVWSLWKTDVALNQLMAPGYVLCWAAKWDGAREVHFASLHHDGKKAMLERIHALISEADVVVTFNGDTFDLPWLNAEFAQAGMKPPPPYKSVDLKSVVKRRFRFPSHKLDYVAKALGIGSKVKHEGHTLWVRCMNNDAEAWRRMERYNRGDVVLQERLYRRVLPWIPNHPNHGLYHGGDRPCCHACGSARLKSKGRVYLAANTYRRYYCLECGAWSRASVRESGPVARRPA